MIKKIRLNANKRGPRGVIAKMLVDGLQISEFEIWLYYYVTKSF